MKRLVLALLLVALATGLFWPDAKAGHHKVAVQSQVFVTTPISIPVGVPVAPYAGVYYENTNKVAAPPPKSAEEVFADKVLAIIEAKQSGHINAMGKITQFGQFCSRCHTQDAASQAQDGRPVFGPVASLTDAQRLSAMRAVLDGSMPKGQKLRAEQVGELFKELTAPPDNAAQTQSSNQEGE